jgi:tRNA-2-methylthio-N6-dimethylallyladenosine synthase
MSGNSDAPEILALPAQKVFLETLGCQSNVLESDHIKGLLKKENFILTNNPDEADVMLFNTCSIRQHAEDKIFSRLGELQAWKKSNHRRRIGVLGCMASSYKEVLIQRMPHLDMVLGPDQYAKLPALLKGKALPTVWTDFDPSFFAQNDIEQWTGSHKAFVEIMKGCDKFCTYCVVPFTRGREISRPWETIREEIQALIDVGVKEITLLGQNVNSYGQDMSKDPISFAALLEKIAQLSGLHRLRFMTSHPMDLSDELIQVMADYAVICHFLHLPVQSGSDVVLKRMNRKYTIQHYRERVATLRKLIPDVALSTDLIVGFPGETELEFRKTLELLDEIQYDSVFSFKYSDREGTPSARMLDKVTEEIKDQHLKQLNEKAYHYAALKHQARIGQQEEVLIDGPADKTPGAWYGKSYHYKTVVFHAPESSRLQAGDFAKVLVQSSKIATLYGTKVN